MSDKTDQFSTVRDDVTQEKPEGIMNFIWIAPEQSKDGGEHIRSHHLQNMKLLAKGNPDIKTILWIDQRRTPDTHIKEIERGLAKINGGDIEIKDLNDLISYRTHPVFLKRDQGKDRIAPLIEQQYDLARLIVLDEQLKNKETDKTFFVDMDVLFLDNAEALNKKMDENGMVFGMCRHNADNANFVLENQFMGFNQKGHTFLKELIENTETSIAKNDRSGWSCFYQTVHDHFDNDPKKIRSASIDTIDFDTAIEISERKKNEGAKNPTHRHHFTR